MLSLFGFFNMLHQREIRLYYQRQKFTLTKMEQETQYKLPNQFYMTFIACTLIKKAVFPHNGRAPIQCFCLQLYIIFFSALIYLFIIHYYYFW